LDLEAVIRSMVREISDNRMLIKMQVQNNQMGDIVLGVMKLL